MGLPEEDRVEKWKTRVAGFVFFLEGDVQQNRDEDEIYASQQAPKNFWFRALKFTIPFRAIFFDSPQIGETQEEYRIILLKAVDRIYIVCNFLYCMLAFEIVCSSDILLVMRLLQPCIPVGLVDICEERTPHVSFILK